MKKHTWYDWSLQHYKTLNKYEKIRVSIKSVFCVLLHILTGVLAVNADSQMMCIWFVLMCLFYVFAVVGTVGQWLNDKEEAYLKAKGENKHD